MWQDWVDLLVAKLQGKTCKKTSYRFKNLELSRFQDFAAVMAPPEDCEVLDTYSFCGEVSNLCLMAFGAEPSRGLLTEAVERFADLVEPTRFLALTVARSDVMDDLLSPVLSKRLRVYLHATLLSAYEGPLPGPAPGEWPWELAETVLLAKASEAAARKRAAPDDSSLLLLTKCRGRRSHAEVP